MPRVALLEFPIAREPTSDTPMESECFTLSESARSAYFSEGESLGYMDLARKVGERALKEYGDYELWRMDWLED